MGHCGGGQGALDRFDLLTPLVDWVEKGAAPDAVTATGRSTAGTQPAAVRLSAARALQGRGRSRDPRPASSAGRDAEPAVDVGRADRRAGRGTGYQRWLVALTALTIVFDGIDNQLMGVAIPTVMREWGVPRSAFAPVISLGYLGMMAGGAIAGLVGDRLGRRTALLGSMLDLRHDDDGRGGGRRRRGARRSCAS